MMRNDHPGLLFARGEQQRAAGRFAQALTAYREAARRYRRIGDHRGLFHCLVAQGHCLRLLGRFRLARVNYQRALTSAAALGPTDRADAEVGLGMSLRALGDHREALRLFARPSRTYRQAGDVTGEAYVLWAMAGALRLGGRLRDSLATFQRARALFEGQGDRSGVGYCLCGMGGVSRVMGRYHASLAYYTAAHRQLTRLRDTFGRAYAACGVANANRMLGRTDIAFANFATARRLYANLRDRVSYAYTLWGEGTLHKVLGQLRRAEKAFAEAEAIFIATRDPRGCIYTRLGLGEILILQGKLRPAQPMLEKARTAARRHGFRFEALHADLLLAALRNRERRRVSLAPLGRRYARLGSVFLPDRVELPINLP
jgi:tetratricopeptide (TPR) repeat protein